MDPLIRRDKGGQAVRVGGFELGQAPVFQDIGDHRIIRRQFLQDIGRCGKAGLGLFAAGQAHFLKQDLSQLFGRADIELPSGLPVDLLFQLRDPAAQIPAVGRKGFGVDPDPQPLHVIQDIGQGPLHTAVKGPHALPGQPVGSRPGRPAQAVGDPAGVIPDRGRVFPAGLAPAVFSEDLPAGLQGVSAVFRNDFLGLIIIFQGIDQIADDLQVREPLQADPVRPFRGRVGPPEGILVLAVKNSRQDFFPAYRLPAPCIGRNGSQTDLFQAFQKGFVSALISRQQINTAGFTGQGKGQQPGLFAAAIGGPVIDRVQSDGAAGRAGAGQVRGSVCQSGRGLLPPGQLPDLQLFFLRAGRVRIKTGQQFFEI